MGNDSCSRGCEFESQRHILNGHFFTLICCKNCIDCLKRQKINEKRCQDWPLLKIIISLFTWSPLIVLYACIYLGRISFQHFTTIRVTSSSSQQQSWKIEFCSCFSSDANRFMLQKLSKIFAKAFVTKSLWSRKTRRGYNFIFLWCLKSVDPGPVLRTFLPQLTTRGQNYKLFFIDRLWYLYSDQRTLTVKGSIIICCWSSV